MDIRANFNSCSRWIWRGSWNPRTSVRANELCDMTNELIGVPLHACAPAVEGLVVKNVDIRDKKCIGAVDLYFGVIILGKTGDGCIQQYRHNHRKERNSSHDFSSYLDC